MVYAEMLLSGYPGFQFKRVNVRLVGLTKLALEVSVNLSGCLSCVFL